MRCVGFRKHFSHVKINPKRRMHLWCTEFVHALFGAQTEQTACKCNSKGVQLTDGVRYKLYWRFLHFCVLWHEISSSFSRLIFPNPCSPAQRCPFLHLCCLPASWNPWLIVHHIPADSFFVQGELCLNGWEAWSFSLRQFCFADFVLDI